MVSTSPAAHHHLASRTFHRRLEHEKTSPWTARREIVRHDDQLQCFFRTQTIRMDRRVTARFFPRS
jgi:hypothetical protein